MRRILLLIYALLVIGCQTTDSSANNSISANNLASFIDVKKAGRELMSVSNGLNKIEGNEQLKDSTLIVTVHGFKSEGYEWINALIDFSAKFSNIYFYRYDWNTCPDIIGKNLAKAIDSLIHTSDNIEDLQVYGHSYGGLVVTYAAGNLSTDIDSEVHSIASPLAGYPRILDDCDLPLNDRNTLQYPTWDTNILHYQWRTQKKQDGAFRDLDFNPQAIELPNSMVTLLPDSMDGHRLGHNWSVTWVARKILKNE